MREGKEIDRMNEREREREREREGKNGRILFKEYRFCIFY